MANEQRFRLHFETTADVAALKAAVAVTQSGATAVQGLTSATRSHTTAVKVDESGVRSWTNSLRQTIPELQRAERAQKAAAITAAEQQRKQQNLDWGKQWRGKGGAAAGMAGGAAMAGTMGGGTDPARALLMASQGIEDAQYGIAGILNNIPGLIMALGGGAGLAGALSIAAVGANQLWKIIGSGDEAVEKSGLKKLIEQANEMKASYEELGTYLKDQFTADLATSRAEWEKEMAAFQESVSAGRKKLAEDNAKADLNREGEAAQGALTRESQIAAGMSPEEAIRHEEEQQRLLAQNAEREKLQREQANAVDNLERGKNDLQLNQNKAAQERQKLQDAPGQKAAEINRLRGGGVISDQEKTVQEYDQAAAARTALNQKAATAEQEVADIQQAMLGTADPIALAGLQASKMAAQRKANQARQQATENNSKMDGLAPFVGQARDQLAQGNVTFKNADESKNLLPEQRAALEQGKANLEGISAGEAQSQKQLAEAEAGIAKWQSGLDGLLSSIEAAKQRLENFNIQQPANDLEAARKGPLDAPLPTLPGQASALPPTLNGATGLPELPAGMPGKLAPDNGPALDINPQATSINDALADTQRQVTQAMTQMADASGQLANATATAIGTVNSRVNEMQTAIQKLKSNTTE